MTDYADVTDQTILIVGVGLIGASFGLALKASGFRGEIIGYARTHDTLNTALALGVIDRAEPELAKAVVGADVVLITTPMLAMPDILKTLAAHVARGTVITDGGSVKASFVEAARVHFGDSLDRVVPGHPIAGREHSGVAAGDATLFQNHRVILTPLAETDSTATALVRALWQRCGGEVVELDIARHDALLAATSHLPHFAAFALVHMLSERPEQDRIFEFAAGGFRDFTRVASSDPVMWRDIALCNTDAVLAELDAYVAALQHMREQVARGDGQALEAKFITARETRNAWLSELEDPEDSAT